MEEEKKIWMMLEQIPQPGFLVKEGRILQVNQAAQALLLAPGMAFSPMLDTGAEEYPDFREGQICLTLTIADQPRGAVVSRMDDCDLVLLDTQEGLEELRSMALVSMELRGPLMQAISSAQQLSGDNPATAKMNQSLMQMLRLVSNLSDISRYQTSCRMETRDVDSFLLELFEKAAALTEGRVSLSYTGLKQPVFSRMDPEQLERAVWNILSNCIKFTPQGGSVQARLTRQGNLLKLTVQDSGSGIAENLQGTLFQRYLRQPGIEDSRYGLGLGLSMIRTVAANHGGTVLICSKQGGTRIAITLAVRLDTQNQLRSPICSEQEGTRITMTLAIRQGSSSQLRSPILRPDYTGGWDHGLVELSDCLPAERYQHF